MPTAKAIMTAAEYRALLKTLGFASTDANAGGAATDEGLSAASRFFGVSPRTGRAWAADGPSSAAAVCLRLMTAAGIDYERAAELLLAAMPYRARGVKLSKRRR